MAWVVVERDATAGENVWGEKPPNMIDVKTSVRWVGQRYVTVRQSNHARFPC